MNAITKLSTKHPTPVEEVIQKNTKNSADDLRFEDLTSELSANFVNISYDKVNDEISLALTRVCELFGVDHCGFLEVLADRKASHYLYKTGPEETLQEALNAFSHPWAYDQLVERAEPVKLSSLEELPLAASADRASWEKEKVGSMLMIPLFVESKVKYLIALYSNRPSREWSVSHIARLRLLGVIFARALIHKRDQEALLKSEWGLAEAERIAHLGSWNWDIIGGTHYWSDEFYRIFGFLPQAFEATYEAFLTAVHPDDRQVVHQANSESLSDPDKPYSIEYRVIHPDGAERIVHARAEILFDLNRKPVRMIGTVLDITEKKLAEDSLERAFGEIMKLKEKVETENIYLQEDQFKEGIPGVIGVSNPLKYVMHRIQQVARTKTTVLLMGETGTGKGVFARALHQASERRDKPFVNVNCAGLPPNLIESELFGREKGAFTGSTARQIGRFELANGGTIFLDEIGELPLELQAKLLKVIEDGEFERLGSPHSVKADVRIIASTNRHLEEEIKKNLFRKDLYYRLSIFPITIPPLRQRKEDIAPLVKFFVAKFNRSLDKGIKKIPAKTLKILEDYAWPGNIRELMNVIERTVILNEGPEFRLADDIGAWTISPLNDESPAMAKEQEKKSRFKGEREHLQRTLESTGWRIEGSRGAAKLLELSPSTLRGRIKKFGIKRPGSH